MNHCNIPHPALVRIIVPKNVIYCQKLNGIGASNEKKRRTGLSNTILGSQCECQIIFKNSIEKLKPINTINKNKLPPKVGVYNAENTALVCPKRSCVLQRKRVRIDFFPDTV